MTAWAYDEHYSLPEDAQGSDGGKESTQGVMIGTKEGRKETYTSLDQAVFRRRGACMVAEAPGEEDGVRGGSGSGEGSGRS